MTFSNRISSRLAAAAGLLFLCSVAAVAQAPSMGQPPQTGMNSPLSPNSNNMAPVPPGGTSPQDMVFVKTALEGGMAEVQLGQIALQKSNDPNVKQFAQKMVDDHTKMGDQMKQLAQQIGVKVPDGPSKKDKAIIAKMQELNGDEFDKAYMKDMVKDHKTDLNDFKIEASTGSNPVVINAANQGSQVIAQHLQMAEQINQKTGTMATNGGAK